MALDRDQGCCEVIIRQSSLLLFSDSRVRKTGELERIFFSFKEVHFFAAAAAITKHLPSSSPDICTFAHPTLKTKSLLTQQLLLLLSSAFKGPLRGRQKPNKWPFPRRREGEEGRQTAGVDLSPSRLMFRLVPFLPSLSSCLYGHTLPSPPSFPFPLFTISLLIRRALHSTHWNDDPEIRLFKPFDTQQIRGIAKRRRLLSNIISSNV